MTLFRVYMWRHVQTTCIFQWQYLLYHVNSWICLPVAHFLSFLLLSVFYLASSDHTTSQHLLCASRKTNILDTDCMLYTDWVLGRKFDIFDLWGYKIYRITSQVLEGINYPHFLLLCLQVNSCFQNQTCATESFLYIYSKHRVLFPSLKVHPRGM